MRLEQVDTATSIMQSKSYDDFFLESVCKELHSLEAQVVDSIMKHSANDKGWFCVSWQIVHV